MTLKEKDVSEEMRERDTLQDMSKADLLRLSVKFAQAADFTQEQDKRIFDFLSAMLDPHP